MTSLFNYAGAFDPINEIADICEKYGCWLHIDVSKYFLIFDANIKQMSCRRHGVVAFCCPRTIDIHDSVELKGKRAIFNYFLLFCTRNIKETF